LTGRARREQGPDGGKGSPFSGAAGLGPDLYLLPEPDGKAVRPGKGAKVSRAALKGF